VGALGWHALLLDALLWLPQPGAGAVRVQLLSALAQSAPAAAVGLMQLLAASTTEQPVEWWCTLMQSLQPDHVSRAVTRPAAQLELLLQLAGAAAWGLTTLSAADGQDSSPVDDDTAPSHLEAHSAGPPSVAAASLALLEHFLGSWQEGLAAAAQQPGSDGGVHCEVLHGLAVRLRGLQPLLQAHVATWTRAQQAGGIGDQAAAGLDATALIHTNTRIMLCLMSWQAVGASSIDSDGTINSAAGARNAAAALPGTSAWRTLQLNPAQPDAVWRASGGSSSPWQRLKRHADSATHRHKGSCTTGTSTSSLISSIVAQCRPHAEVKPPSAVCAAAPLLQLPALSADPSAGSGNVVVQAAEHVLALVFAWLTPGALCWWPLPCTPALVAAAGADAFAPARTLAALLDMLAHSCDASDPAASGSPLSPALHPAASQLLAALAVEVGADVVSPDQQRALLLAAYASPPPPTAAAAAAGCAQSPPSAADASSSAARRLVVMQGRLLEGDGVVLRSASAALVAVSNRLIARDGAGQEVVPTREQQAGMAAEAARALLPHALLWPGAVLRRLLQDGVAHRAQQPVIAQLLGALGPLCAQAPGGADAASALPSRLLRQLHEELLGSSVAVATRESDRAAAAELVLRLLQAKLLNPQQALLQLVTAPLMQVWDAWGGGADGSSSIASSGMDVARLRMLLELAELLLPADANSIQLSMADRWSVALGLSAAAEQLRGRDGSGSMQQGRAPDLVGLAQAERVLDRVVGLAGVTAAAVQQQDPSSSPEEVPSAAAACGFADDLAVLPWARRLALLPLLEAIRSCGSLAGADWQLIDALLQPVVAPGGGQAAAVHRVRQTLDFAASSDANAQLLSLCVASGAAGQPGSPRASTPLSDQIAADLAAAVQQLPGDTLRRALLLAVGRLMPCVTEGAARRALQDALPAILATKAAAASAAAPKPAIAASATMQLACRAAFVFLSHARWAVDAAPSSLQLAAEQCFRHINALAMHLIEPHAAPAAAAASAAAAEQLQRARHETARMCLRECCQLAAALHARCDTSPMRALLLRLLSDVCKPPVTATTSTAPQQEQRPEEEAPARTAAPQQRSSVQLADLTVAFSGQPLTELLTWAAQQVALVPDPNRALLVPALMHMGVGAAAAAAGGGVSALQGAVEELVEAAVAERLL